MHPGGVRSAMDLFDFEKSANLKHPSIHSCSNQSQAKIRVTKYSWIWQFATFSKTNALFISAFTWLFLLFWQHDDISHILHEVTFIISQQNHGSKLLTHVSKAPWVSRLDLRWLHYCPICLGDDTGGHNASIWVLNPLDWSKASHVHGMCHILTGHWPHLLHIGNGKSRKLDFYHSTLF